MWSNGAHDGVSRSDVDPLDRLDATRPLDEQTLWAIGIVNGDDVDVDEVESRLSAPFLEQLPPAAFRAGIADLATNGPFRFDGVVDREDSSASLVRLSDVDGNAFSLVTILSTDRARVEGLQFTRYSPPTAALDGVQALLAVLAAFSLAYAATRLVEDDRRWNAWASLAIAALWLTQFGVAAAPSIAFTGALAVPWAAVGLMGGLLVPVDTARTAKSVTVLGGFVGLIVGSAWLVRLDTTEIGLPRNLLSSSTDASAGLALVDARAIAALAFCAASAVAIVGRHRVGRIGSRISSVVAGTSLASLATVAALSANWMWVGERVSLVPSAWLSVALVVVGIGGAADSWARAAAQRNAGLDGVAQLVIDLGDDVVGTSIGASLRRALADPSLEVLLWSAERDGYLDVDGHRVEPHAAGRQTTELGVDGRRLGLVLHDAQLQPDRVRAACSAVGLALRNAQLQTEIQAQLVEVEGSRRRLVTATDDARRQMERDLHDGTQQRVLATLMDLERARRQLASDPDAAEHTIESATEQLHTTLRELRDLSRGLRPGALDRGLVPALRELTERSPIPVALRGERRRTDPNVEHAAWFVVSEALANAWKHSGADRVEVFVEITEAGIDLTVGDDGNGVAVVQPGGGLEGLKDRIEAQGGRFEIVSDPEAGTMLRAWIPTTIDARPGRNELTCE